MEPRKEFLEIDPKQDSMTTEPLDRQFDLRECGMYSIMEHGPYVNTDNMSYFIRFFHKHHLPCTVLVGLEAQRGCVPSC